MPSHNVMGLLFPNMHDEALRDLTAERAMGSVPVGGRYRLIDFALSSMVNAGINKVGILTKNNYQSLMDHIGSGKAWDLSRKNEGLYFLPPYGSDDTLYNGRIHALSSIDPFLCNSREEYVLLSDCHMLGNIDYRALIQAHLDSGAEVTIGCKTGLQPGMLPGLVLRAGADGLVTDVALGCEGDDGYFGVGLYLLSKATLRQWVAQAKSYSFVSFERDILQRLAGRYRLQVYPIPEYTALISSLESYFKTNLALLDPAVRAAVFRADRPVYTKVRDSAPAKYGLEAAVSDALIADGCKIEGTVRHSLLFRDVKVSRGTVLENCIVMQGSLLCEGCSLDSAVIDKNVVVKDGRRLRGCESYPIYIRKNAVV